MTEKAYLYFLFDANDSVFKIGKALDVRARVQQLSDQINIQKSRCLVFVSKPNFSAAAQVFKVESFLKSFCKDFNAPRAHKKDGYTEWYHASAYEIVSKFTESNRVFLGCSELQILPGGFPDARPVLTKKPRYPSGQVKARHQEEDAKYKEENGLVLNLIYDWLAETIAEGSILGWHTGHLITWKSKIKSPGLLALNKRHGSTSLISHANFFGNFRCHGFAETTRWPEIFQRFDLSVSSNAFSELFRKIPAIPFACVEDLNFLIESNLFSQLHLSKADLACANEAFDERLNRITSIVSKLKGFSKSSWTQPDNTV